MKIVNIVSTGDINQELELSILHEDICTQYNEYNPEKFAALKLRFKDNGPTVLLFRSGKYTITGASSREQLRQTDENLSKSLKQIEVIGEEDEFQSKIVNFVCTDDLGRNIDLPTLQTIVGFENAEYEPEQSPFMVYRPKEYNCVMTIATSGKIVINGVTDTETAKEAVEDLKRKLP